VVYSDYLELFVVFEITKSCNLSLLWVCFHPSCVEVIEIVIGFVTIPLSVEVIVVGLVLCLVPLSEEVIVV